MSAVGSFANLFDFNLVVQSIKDLTEILRSEIEEIKSNNIKIISESFERKSDLINFVESMKEVIYKNPQIAKNLTEQQKTLLKNVAQELQESVTLNNSELMKAKYFNDELIKLVVAAVENASTPMKTYDRYGKRPKHSKLKTPASITLNKKV